MSINRVILLGNVGRDPEIRPTTTGDQIATFSIATSETWKDKTTGERKESTEWHNIVCFNQGLVKIIQEYVTKGSRVAIEGKMKTRKWQHSDGTDRYSTEVVIGRFDGSLSLEGKPSGATRSEDAYGSTKTRESYSGSTGGGSSDRLDDEIPF
ncbi:single-stranded DNA-binding protein [Rhodomicrobium udaipurense JA643]|uniref:Single-stranded DNA-binding protein n=1 Tax=Rhodomicrobium udaipurense TaxID=1202716 RepID=A0A8I1G9X4_9HYPH|nr:single-stranded DNA-binding protein [Rhodomicrobium udaipurense]KAI93528.1 single-stranded DNA-binding protein [Rhodomicrobium udaipurense JA643]MBJ7543228.1 single-stranded DNA-binding protein [Rhodomicrobium udaipurense]